MAGFGSLGGLGGSDNFGNVMQALGMSLMGSPRNAPLTNFGPMLQGLQQTSMERRASEEQRAAWEQALIGAGIDPAMARTYAANPQAAKFQLDTMQQQQERAQQQQQMNATREFLAQNDPELAAMVDAGMPVNEAFAIYAKKKMEGSQRQGLMNTSDGIYDPNTGQWIMPPNGGATEAPKVVEIFDDATGQPYKATWNPETRTFDRVGGVKARSGMQLTTNPDGTVTMTEGPMNSMPKLTESEGRNAGFYGRGIESDKVLRELESEGTSLGNKITENLPVVGNYLRGPNAQKFSQAKRDFINAVLRRESGAVISPEEFANAEQQYFPQPGDGPEVIAQKRRNREVTIQGLKVSSGQGANFAIPGQTGQEPAATGEGWTDMGGGVRIRRK